MLDSATTSTAYGVEPTDDGGFRVREMRLPVGRPGPRDLLVRVEAVSVNPVDVKVARTLPGYRTLGYDACGVVEQVGDEVGAFVPSDRVFYAGTLARPGSHQTRQLVDDRIVGRAPATLSALEAAALPLTAITAWEALVDHLRLSAESAGTLLVVGAGGGAGSMIVQLARVLAPNVRVIGTASRPETASWVMQLGAHAVVDHSSLLVDQVRAIAPAVEWIVSTASAGRIPDYAELIAPFGTVVGLDGGPIDVTPLKSKSATWSWEYMFTRANPRAGDPPHQRRILTRLAELVDAGLIRSTTTNVAGDLGIDTLTQAFDLVASGTAVGKTVLRVTD